MQVNVLIEHGEELVGGFPIEELCTFVMKKMNLPECTDVTVTFVTNERIHELNRDYRGIDRPTDVLSFECDNVPLRMRSWMTLKNLNLATLSSLPM